MRSSTPDLPSLPSPANHHRDEDAESDRSINAHTSLQIGITNEMYVHIPNPDEDLGDSSSSQVAIIHGSGDSDESNCLAPGSTATKPRPLAPLSPISIDTSIPIFSVLAQTKSAPPRFDGMRSTSPIDNLPVEMLCYIFLLCCEVNTYNSDSDCTTNIPSQSSSPVPLTLVSRYWRAVSIRLCPIWSVLRITPGRSSSVKTLAWLERSGNHPLRIGIHPDRLGCNMQALYDLLMPHAHRWRSFHLIERSYSASDFNMIPSPLTKTLKDDSPPAFAMPKLETLYINRIVFQERDFSVRYPVFTSINLKRLIVNGVNFAWEYMSPSLCNITHFHLSQNPMNMPYEYICHLMGAIGQMKSLQHLVIIIGDLQRDGNLDLIEHPMVLPELQTATFNIDGNCGALWIWLSNLKASRLRRLRISHLAYEDICEDGGWHGEIAQSRWISLQSANQFSSLTDFLWKPEGRTPCGQTLAAFIPAISNVLRITVETRHLEFLPSTLFSSACACPRLEHVNIKEFPSKSQEDIPRLIKAISKLNPDASVTVGVSDND